MNRDSNQTASGGNMLSSGLAVLVADDDPIFRSLAASRLVRLNCRIVEAEDGGSAWQLVRSNVFNLAIVDYEMPGLDGVALIQCLRSHPRSQHIPIVMCTSRNDSAAMQAALEAGASSFLTKPVNWSLFERHIRHLLHVSEKAAEAAAAIARLEAEIAARDADVAQMIAGMKALLQAGAPGTNTAPALVSRMLRAQLDAFEAAYPARQRVPAAAAVPAAQKTFTGPLPKKSA